MPLYEFRCPACGGATEELRRPGETAPPPACEACGGPMTRVLSPPVAPPRHGRERAPGGTCCGREERCDVPPFTDGGCPSGSGSPAPGRRRG